MINEGKWTVLKEFKKINLISLSEGILYVGSVLRVMGNVKLHNIRSPVQIRH